MNSVHVVLPNDVDDPTNPSGGNVYDRRICQGLAASGWLVREHPVRGAWPHPDAMARATLARVLAALPDNAVVLLDGLIASVVPDILAAHAYRLRLVVLVHLPLGDETADLNRRERRALSIAAAVVTTSRWSRQRLLDLYALPANRVHVAEPGVDPAPLVAGSATGSHLLCVAAVMASKGHDLLVEALAMISDLPWSCVCVGTLDRDRDFADRLRRRAHERGIADHLKFVGAQTGTDLDAQYIAADLLVLASRGESYGMVVTEALARGTPVLATTANGLPEALGRAPDASLPGILVAPNDPAALAEALRCWLTDADLRRQLRQSAQGRRTTLTGWPLTARFVSSALAEAAATVGAGR